jgi:hypothetical protein
VDEELLAGVIEWQKIGVCVNYTNLVQILKEIGTERLNRKLSIHGSELILDKGVSPSVKT